jgi:hypothetical protein
MTDILAVKTSLREWQRPATFETFRAEALFASTLQPSELPSAEQVRTVVATTVRQLGIGGCAARTASEFGDHPDTAVARMCWALMTIRAVYPRPSMTPATKTPATSPRLLAFAS